MGKPKINYADIVKSIREAEVDSSSSATSKKILKIDEYAESLGIVEKDSETEFCDESDKLISRKRRGEFSISDTYSTGTEYYDEDRKDTIILAQITNALSARVKKCESEVDYRVQQEQKTTSEGGFPIQKLKTKEKDLSLQDMENAILQAVPLIRHDGGVYYFNGRTYVALKNDMDLMELIRRQKVSASCFQTRSIKIFTDLFTFLKTDPYLVPENYEDQLRKCRNYVVLNNGVLNVKKLVLKSFDKKYLTFHSINANWVENPKPKRFLKFLNDAAMGDPSIVRLTLQVIGCLLSSLNLCKKFFVIGLAHDSGKSTIALLLKKLIGEEFVVSIPPNNLSDRFSLGSTRGKIINLAMDIPNGKLNATAVSRIKNITGLDAITIEEKYMRSESTVSNLRFLFGTNYPITLPREDDDDAFWERMVIIPFMRSVPSPEIDRNLLDKLLDERDDIVSLCLQNLSTVILNNYTFSPCPRGEEMKKSWRRSEFSTASMVYFWNNCVEETGEPQDTVYASELHGAYLRYCAENEMDPVSYMQMLDWIAKNTDPERCEKKRIHKSKANPMSGFAGIKVNQNNTGES